MLLLLSSNYEDKPKKITMLSSHTRQAYNYRVIYIDIWANDFLFIQISISPIRWVLSTNLFKFLNPTPTFAFSSNKAPLMYVFSLKTPNFDYF
jgi:hypothetical protein